MINRFLCFIGWHEWRWKLPKGEPLDLNSNPPQYAKCDHCGITFGKFKPK
jgi:hypothetical protein